jgi:hypothetical protein
MALLARLAALTALLHAPLAAAADEAPSTAMAPQVQAQYDAGMAHYAARDFAGAARAFAAAYALDPRRDILFARAQATRLSGDCPAAVELYRAFLATQPPQQQVEATQLALSRCRDVPAPATPTLPAPPQLKVPAGNARPPLVPRPIWWRDRVGLSLAAGAVVSWGIAIGIGVAAARADSDARTAAFYDVTEDRRHVAEDRARWAQRAAIAGAAFTTAATGRFLWVGFHRATPIVGVEGRF